MEQYEDDGRDEYGQGMELQFAMYPKQEHGMAEWEYLSLWNPLRHCTLNQVTALVIYAEILKADNGGAMRVFERVMMQYASTIPGSGVTQIPTDKTQH